MKKIKLTPRKLRRMEEHRLRKEQYQAERAAERTGRLVPVVRDIDERNRQNAQASTGPVTEEGKAVSSRNAVRHGLTGIFCILPHEDRAAYELLLNRLRNEHQPADTTEELLVSDMARHYWLTQRALAYQEDVFTRFDLSDPAAQKQLAIFIRYQTTNQRIFHKSLAELQKAQRVRLRAPSQESESDALRGARVTPQPFCASSSKTQKQRQANNLADGGFVSQNAENTGSQVAQTVLPAVSPSSLTIAQPEQSGFVSQNKENNESKVEQTASPAALLTVQSATTAVVPR